MKMEQTGFSETSAYKILTPDNYPEESIQYSEHGENLKLRILKFWFEIMYGRFKCRTRCCADYISDSHTLPRGVNANVPKYSTLFWSGSDTIHTRGLAITDWQFVSFLEICTAKYIDLLYLQGVHEYRSTGFTFFLRLVWKVGGKDVHMTLFSTC